MEWSTQKWLCIVFGSKRCAMFWNVWKMILGFFTILFVVQKTYANFFLSKSEQKKFAPNLMIMREFLFVEKKISRKNIYLFKGLRLLNWIPLVNWLSGITGYRFWFRSPQICQVSTDFKLDLCQRKKYMKIVFTYVSEHCASFGTKN